MGFKWVRQSGNRKPEEFSAKDFFEIGEIMIPRYPVFGMYFFIEESESSKVQFPLLVLNLEVQFVNKRLMINAFEIYKPLTKQRNENQAGLSIAFRKIPIPSGLSRLKYPKSWAFIEQDSSQDSEVINSIPLKRIAKELIAFDVLVQQFPDVEDISRLQKGYQGKLEIPFPKYFEGSKTATYTLLEVHPVFRKNGIEWFRRVISSETEKVRGQVNLSLGKIHHGSKPSCDSLGELVQEAKDLGVSVHSYIMDELNVSRPTVERLLKQCREEPNCPKNIKALKNPKGGRPIKAVKK